MMKAYFKRGATSFDGVFTIQELGPHGDVIKLVDRVAARSGQASYYNQEWIKGKSPIPRGEFKLWLKPNHVGMKPGERGIGEFFPISSDDSRVIIREEDCAGFGPHPVSVPLRRRSEIGLHCENALPGSAGCIVIVRPNDFSEVSAILKAAGIHQDYIPIKVF